MVVWSSWRCGDVDVWDKTWEAEFGCGGGAALHRNAAIGSSRVGALKRGLITLGIRGDKYSGSDKSSSSDKNKKGDNGDKRYY